MSEVKRFSEGRFSGFGAEHPQGCWVRAEDFDRVTAERDAALGREKECQRQLGERWKDIEALRNTVESQSERLTAADERADSFDRLYTSSLDERDQLQQRADVLEGLLRRAASFTHDFQNPISLRRDIYAALKPAEALRDKCSDGLSECAECVSGKCQYE